MTIGTVVVTGVDRPIGRATLDQLMLHDVPVRILVDSPAAVPTVGGNLEVLVGDLTDPEVLRRALDGADGVLLSTAGDGQLAIELSFLEALAENPPATLVRISRFGASLPGPHPPLTALHRELEAAFAAAEIACTSLQVNALMQDFLPLAGMIREHQVVCTESAASEPVAYVDARDVGEVAASVLMHTAPIHTAHTDTALTNTALTDTASPRELVLNGPEALLPLQVADTFTAALGPRIQFLLLPPEAMNQATSALELDGWGREAMTSLSDAHHSVAARATFSDIAAITGHAPRTFLEFARNHRLHFTAPAPDPADVAEVSGGARQRRRRRR